MVNRKTLSLAVASAAVFITAEAAQSALVLPGFTMEVFVDGALDATFSAGEGFNTGDATIYEWKQSDLDDNGVLDWAGPAGGSLGGNGWSFGSSWTTTIDEDQRRASFSGGFENNDGADHNYTIRINAPVLAALANAEMFGSTEFTVNDADGDGNAQMAAINGLGFLTGLIDGVGAVSLLDGFNEQIVSPFDGSTLGGSTPGFIAAPNLSSTIGIEFNFSLTAGDIASMSGTFVVIGDPVPAPGAFALLGLAGLAGTRRRRR